MDLTLSQSNEQHSGSGNSKQQHGQPAHHSYNHPNQVRFWHHTRRHNQQQHHWKQQNYRQQFQWNFSTAFLYSLTVITTVGK